MNALPVASAPPNPHFERLGGEGAVRRLVDAFYDAMSRREDARAIRALHGADLTHTKAVLVLYLCEWLGGPKQYTAERGPPRMRRVHQPFAIDESARQAWMACMQQALQETCADTDLQHALLAAMAQVAEHVQNTPAVSTHQRKPS